MDHNDPDSGLCLAWIGTPLRKRLDETLQLPLPWELARWISGSEAEHDAANKNPPGLTPGG
jgi:hypothetical protein